MPDTPTPQGVVAWIMEFYDGDTIVFAPTKEDAWRSIIEDELGGMCEGPCRVGECDCYSVSAPDREPFFDKYAPGPIPLQAYRARGWRWPCVHCTEHGYPEPVDDWEVVDGQAVCNECIRVGQRDA